MAFGRFVFCNRFSRKEIYTMQGIILNQDSDNFLVTRLDRIEQIDKQYLQNFIYQYQGTQVTDFMMCVCVPISAFPSKVRTFYGDKYMRNEEYGTSVDYTKTCCKTAYHIWYEKKLDLFQIWIDACRASNITPWISFRMNDAHCHFEAPHYLLSDFFYEHIDEYARVHHEMPYGANRGYSDRCRDYEIEEVRAEMLAYIKETLTRYDVDGIELDFQRELWCFQPGHEQNNIHVMTAFIKEVKNIAKEAAKHYKHTIKIAVRCHPNPVYCMEFGFDILEWAKQGLVDLVVPSPRWATTDNDMPIRLWKNMLEPYSVQVAGCVELLSRSYPGGKMAYNTAESAIGSAVNILSQGADKLYLFNYFDKPDEMLFGKRRKITEENDVQKAEGYYKLLTTAGDLEKAIYAKRKHIVTYNDVVPLNRKFMSDLPIAVTEKGPYFIRVVTGTVPHKSRVLLRLGIEQQEAFDPKTDVTIYVNSHKIEFLQTQEYQEPVLTQHPIYAFLVPNEAVGALVQMAEIYADKKIVIYYADIIVNAE